MSHKYLGQNFNLCHYFVFLLDDDIFILSHKNAKYIFSKKMLNILEKDILNNNVELLLKFLLIK